MPSSVAPAAAASATTSVRRRLTGPVSSSASRPIQPAAATSRPSGRPTRTSQATIVAVQTAAPRTRSSQWAVRRGRVSASGAGAALPPPNSAMM
ncbi:hypothetical protein VSR01_22805 [Actinacidiphila sp. DG2A-62]|uniref:hypothetical protein n=1 Tax=Actinacidiphila sp. DG2A-62 TaxID=3108821 RepID=UPI002DBD4391|nr:hypothetical protein [Actinacidiphila sp. DG2A-62]MEC3996192.1 hypothetical protein [Actinacidiphila sp. DG2A-62]